MKERGASVNVSSLEEKHLHTVKESPLAEHMVSVLQAQPLLLLSTGTVQLSALSPFSCPSAAQPGATVPPTAREEGASVPSPPLTLFFFFFPSLPTACYIRYEELTHNPFMQPQMEQECN